MRRGQDIGDEMRGKREERRGEETRGDEGRGGSRIKLKYIIQYSIIE